MLAPAVELPLRRPVTAFWVEGHASAAAEDAVVALHQCGEGRPGRFIERPDRVDRFHRDSHRTVAMTCWSSVAACRGDRLYAPTSWPRASSSVPSATRIIP